MKIKFYYEWINQATVIGLNSMLNSYAQRRIIIYNYDEWHLRATTTVLIFI